MATRTKVIGSVEGERICVKRRVVATTTRQGSGKGLLLVEQMRQHSRTGAVHGGARGPLGRLQIQVAGLAQIREDDLQQSLYFAGDLVTANSGSASVSVLLGKPDGTFGPKSDFAVSANPSGAATGDSNGDGLGLWTKCPTSSLTTMIAAEMPHKEYFLLGRRRRSNSSLAGGNSVYWDDWPRCCRSWYRFATQFTSQVLLLSPENACSNRRPPVCASGLRSPRSPAM